MLNFDADINKLIGLIQVSLTSELLNKYWRIKSENSDRRYVGHCYHASEALFHLLGGYGSGWSPKVMKVGNDTHWFLQKGNEILDPTKEQFPFKLNYASAKGCGFLTKLPSKKSMEVISRVMSNI